ncbi:MAG TPA: hypothetical protein PK435_14350 [Thermoanaerobaculaceae bacterium]|nr:hypothetical protein [Thermoanaerobaculaceae bacterium]
MRAEGSGRGFRSGRRLLVAAVALCGPLAAGCTRAPAFRLRPLAAAAPEWRPALPATHEPLTAVLALFPGGRPGTAWSAGAGRVLDAYLAALAGAGPRTRPDLFPSGDHALAYLADAHVAWTIALGENGGTAGLDVRELRDLRVPLDGGTTTLRGLEAELARRAPYEPRLALFLNPGWRGGPPLPDGALDGDAFRWQLARQARRCGDSGFWAFDPVAHRLTVSAFAAEMWGLPEAPLIRARRLLELVPPPAAMRDAVTAACGASLERCTLAVAPIDSSRLLMPAPQPR